MAEGMSAKEIYDRRKRLKQERMLREEESAAVYREQQDESEVLFASLCASMERIADALEIISNNWGRENG